jgi:hypothetical protein
MIMKKALPVAVVSCIFGISSLFSQSIEVVGSKVANFWPATNGYTDCSIHLKNKGASGMKIGYEKVSADFPAAWSVSFCDNNGCFFSLVDNGTFAPMNAGEESSLKITVDPKGMADTAVVKYAVFDISNPVQRDTLVFNIFVRWGANNADVVVRDMQLGPNPATDNITLRGEGYDAITIYDIKGNLVINKKPEIEQTVIDISGLPSGVYMLNAANHKQLWSRRFVKN